MTDEKQDDLEKKVADDKKLSKKEKDEVLNKNAIEINPSLNEAPDKTVVLGWGRMNPITVGHEKLVNKIKSVARANSATPLIYITHSQDAKKNPLDYDTKVSLAKKAFGNKVIQKSNSKTIMQVMKELQGGYSRVILVVGQDRVTEFDKLLKKYNGKDYTFDSIEVVSAGDRDPDAEGVEGMSASKMRAAAASGKFDQFKSGLPRKLKRDAQDIYDLVRGGMKIAEMMELDEGVMSLQQRRQRALTMRKYANKIAMAKKRMAKRKAPIAKLKQRARKAAIKIIRSKVAGKTKGANYANLNPSEKMQIDKKVAGKSAVVAKIAKRLLPQIKKAEMLRLSNLGKTNESFELQEGKMKEFDSYVKSGKDAKWISKKMGMDLKTVKDIIAYLSESVDLNAEFEALYEASCGTHTEEKPKKRRFHQMYSKKSGKLLLDRRFKAFRNLPKDDDTEANNAMLKAQRACESFETDESLIAFIEQVTNDISDSITLAEDKRQIAIQEKAIKSGFAYEVLEEVFQRGLDSYQESESMTAEQWAFTRVNSFISGGKNTIEEDADLYEARKKQNSSARDRLLKGLKKHGYDADKIIKRAKDAKKEGLEVGTDEIRKTYTKDTPGQSIDEAFEEMFEARQDSDIKDKEGTQPAKYYTGLAKSTKSKRDAHFKKGAKMDDDNPAAYKPAPGDAEAETKPSKHTKKFKQMYGESTQLDEDATKALKKKAEKSGMPLGILRKVYDRGVAAWRTGHRPGTNPQQWGLARVNSFVTKSSGTWGKADADLAKKVRGEAVNPAQQAAIAISKKKSGKYDEDGKRLDEAFELFAEKVDLQAGVNDPGIFKAVFLAGGPGSGKSFIVGKTALTTLGLVLINSDDAFERQLAKIGLDTTPEDIFSPAGQAVRGKAKALTKLKQKLAVRGRLGLVIDGTGKDFEKIKKQSEELKRIGYETAMIFVNTDLDTALARNKARKRTLPDADVTKMWKAVQNNIGKFQRYYGDKMVVVDNSDSADYEANVLSAYRKMSAFTKTAPKLPVAKKWIAQQKKERGIKK
jgi:predicted kinase/nicotinic acid mononucleotide adenylyltransferase